MDQVIYNYLCNCKELIDIIEGVEHIFPIFARSTAGVNIEYSYRDIKGDILTQGLLNINILGSNFEQLLKVKEILNKKLNFKLKDNYINIENYKFNSGLGGGSTPLYNQNLNIYMIGLSYIIKYIELKGE